MATEAERLFSTYMQSHAERYAKFREEAYKEFQNEQKTAQDYRDELAAREKAYIKGIEALKKAQAGGLTDIEALRLLKDLNALEIESQEEARRQRLSIESESRKELTIPEAAQRKLDERGQALSTSGSLITDPAGIEAFFNASVGDVAAAVRGGTRNAASTGQSLYKQISSSPQFAKLTTAQRQNLRNSIVNSFGLDQVNIGGIAGEDLLDAPQDVLLQKEVDAQLAKEGGAYGVANIKALKDRIAALQDPTKQAEAKAASAAELKPLADELAKIQEKLKAAPLPSFPSEAAVRQRAAEKYGFESAKFLKSQFERDMLGTDQDKLLHYDAIQAAKAAPYKSSDDIYRAAKIYSDALKDKLGGSKADKRKVIIEKAAEYGGGDPNKRDEFLIAFHQVELEKAKGRSGTSDVLPEPPPEPVKAPPPPELVEPRVRGRGRDELGDPLGPVDKLPGRGSLTGVDREARLAEVERDIGVRQAITDKMVDLVRQKDALDKIGIANFTPEQEQKYDDLMAGMDILRTEYNKPQYDPAIFAAERADMRRALFPTYSKPLNEMLEAERLKLAQGEEEFPSGFEVPPRRVRTSIGNLPSMSDLFANELEAALPRQKQIQR